MRVTGYQLRDALKTYELRAEAANRAFEPSLVRFASETKKTPDEVAREYTAAHDAIARLQVAQMKYNLAVTVKVGAMSMTLAEAIKRMAAPVRIAKLWKEAMGKKKDRYGLSGVEVVRDKDKEYAVASVTAEEATAFAQKSAKEAAAYRSAIAVGNAQEVDIDGLDAALLA